MKNRSFLLIILLSTAIFSFAEQLVTGVVMDQQSEPIIGAAVKIVGTTQGTVTDFDGNFTLQANPNQSVEVSYLGYVSQVVTVAQLQKNGKVFLKEDTQALEEVVVVGYGTQKKSVVTAAISKVNA